MVRKFFSAKRLMARAAPIITSSFNQMILWNWHGPVVFI